MACLCCLCTPLIFLIIFSILCAMKTYRDRGAAEFGVTKPEIIIPESAHAAFIKGAHYFGYKLVYAKIRDDWRVDLDDVRRLVNANTVMVVGSAPSFPHGVIDDIEALGDILKDHPQAGLHVDACLGGFILPWLQQQKKKKKDFDFAIPRVCVVDS